MKNMAKLSLLLLLGVAQQNLEAKPSLSQDTNKDEKEILDARKKLPTVKENEKEKKRVIYHIISRINQEKIPNQDILTLPQLNLEWSSLPQVKNVTEAQLTKAQHEYELQEEPIQKLCEERTEYLIKKYPVYAELQKLMDALDKYRMTHRKELMIAFHDQMNEKEMIAAENKAQPYFWKYWQLQNQYNREHDAFHGPAWRPYLKESGELSTQEIQKLARNAKMITLAPGNSLELPTLAIAAIPNRVIKYSLALPNGKMVSADVASLRTKTTVPKEKALVGGTSKTIAYTLSAPRHAKPASFYVLEHHLMGDISVYATVRITKGEDSVPRAKNRPTKPSQPKRVMRQEITPVALVPVKQKHTSGKKATTNAPVKKIVKKDDTTDIIKN